MTVSACAPALLALGLVFFGDETPAQDAPKVSFEALAQDFFASYGIEPAGLDFPGLLASEHFAHVELGSFDLHLPIWTLSDSETCDAFEEVALTLVDLQSTWFRSRSPETYTNEVRNDWKTLSRWVGSWSAARLGGLDGSTESMLTQLGASAKVREAQDRLRAFTKPPQATIDAVGDLSVLVLAPTRRDFLHLAAAGGSLYEPNRDTLWNQNVVSQATAWVGWTQVVALEYPQRPVDMSQPFVGASMNQRDQLGFRQYMADRGAAFLLRKEFWRHGTHFFEESLGTNLVISAVGENNLDAGEWNIGYKSSGASTQPYQRFVPGGNPSGGTLPPRKAQATFTFSGSFVSRYRTDLGEKFFVKSLREGQKAGQKIASKDKTNLLRKNKVAHFELVPNMNSEPDVSANEIPDAVAVTAPFLGDYSKSKKLPPNVFLDDYEDLFRAYRSCFIHWLEEHGGEDESATRFGELIARHALRPVDTPLDEVIEEVYGMPISAPDDSTDSLEWRFLGWLKRLASSPG